MIKRKCILLSIIIGVFIMSLTGCGRDSVSELPEEIEEEEKTEQDDLGTENEEDVIPQDTEIPQLPDTGRDFYDFIPDGWWLNDWVQLDFNEDEIPDYVIVIENEEPNRILFAIAGDGADGYRLDFQDNNLISGDVEGGIERQSGRDMLTAEGTSFTTHVTFSHYGDDSKWRWLEEYTYTYRDGVWWLTLSEITYGYVYHPNNIYVTSYLQNDWESGVGIRKRRSSEPDDMEGKGNSAGYDVEYEFTLDEPMTLAQAGMRTWGAVKKAGLEVESITYGEEVELTQNDVKLPQDGVYISYYDEDYALYTFGSDFCYLAIYRRQDGVLSVITKEELIIDEPKIYKGKIYYSIEISDGTDTVGLRLKRMDMDGTGKETVFEYRYPEGYTGGGIPYPALNFEISGDEIVVEVSIKVEPHTFYRMNTDGSGLKYIGRMPKELEIPEEENGVMEIYDGGGKLAIHEDVITAQVSLQDILKGNPVIYDRFRIDGWIFEWLISDYHEEGDWSLEDAVLLVSRENSTEDTQIIHVTADGGYGTWVLAENKFEYVDVNFDNIPDLLICTGHHGNQGLLTYYCFLQNENGFVEAPTFTDISNPAIDADNKLILSQWRNSAASHSWAEYKYQNKEYVMYRELCEDLDHSGGEEVWVWTVNGEEAARSDELTEEEIFEFLYGENSEWKIMDDRWRTLYNNGLTADYSIYSEP